MRKIIFKLNDDNDTIATDGNNFLILGDEEVMNKSDEEKKELMMKVLNDFKDDDAMKSEYDYWMSVINESKLTEAPDDDGIMTDDELDAEEQRERDEFEARLKARRDKVASQRAKRDSRIAKEKELIAQAEPLLKEIGDDWSFEHLFDVLVPASGKSNNLAGELIRAVNKIEYRWFNDGDRWFEDYGIETCGQPAYFITYFTNMIPDEDGDLDEDIPFWNIMLECAEDNKDEDNYEAWIEKLKETVVDYINQHQDLLAKETTDMYSVPEKDVRSWLDEYMLIPKYEVEFDIPDEVLAHLEKGNIDYSDVEWEIEGWVRSSADINVGRETIEITELEKADYENLKDSCYDWIEDYGKGLTDEYGDPFAEDEEEEEEESEETDESLLKEGDIGYDHYGPKNMKSFKGPAFIEYDGGPRQIEVLVKARNGRWVWKNKGGCPDSEWYIFPTYEDALAVQKKVGGEILSWNEYAGIKDDEPEEEEESLKENKELKEELDSELAKKLQALDEEGGVYFDIAHDKDGDEFLIVDGWEDVHKIQKALKPDFEPKDEDDTSVLDELFDNGYAWGFRDEYSKCDECGQVIRTGPQD